MLPEKKYKILRSSISGGFIVMFAQYDMQLLRNELDLYINLRKTAVTYLCMEIGMASDRCM